MPDTASPAPAALSVQLYSFRRQLADDLDDVLARISALGLDHVEPFALDTMADQLAARLPAHGLTAPTTHVDVLNGDQSAVLAAAAAVGVQTVIQPHLDPALWTSAADVAATAERLNAAAQAAAEFGIRVGYHNHHFELENTVDGRPALEVLADQLEGGAVLEVDTYWAYCGGVDVPELLGRLDGLVVALHLKDGDGTLDTMAQAPAGSGVMPIWDVIGAAPEALRVIEFDDYAGDIYAGVEASLDFLRATR